VVSRGYATGIAELDFPTFRGQLNLALMVALEICDGHEIQFEENHKAMSSCGHIATCMTSG
jgi:hypothetical protein